MSTKKWSVEGGDSIKIVDESGACIATMPRWSRFSSEEQLDNALLMASASSLKEQNAELLAALKLVYSNAGESPEWIRSRIGPAIAKATAEQKQQ